jgi:hypothetical protein
VGLKEMLDPAETRRQKEEARAQRASEAQHAGTVTYVDASGQTVPQPWEGRDRVVPTCPRCHQAVSPEWEHCIKCGAPLLSKPSPSRPKVDTRPLSSAIMTITLMAALVAAFAGIANLSNATAGVGLLAVGCVAAIIARIAQADVQHAEALRAIRESRKEA